MPFVQIFLIENRSEEQKQAVIDKVTRAVQEAVDAPIERIRVWIHEVPAENWGIAGASVAGLNRSLHADPPATAAPSEAPTTESSLP